MHRLAVLAFGAALGSLIPVTAESFTYGKLVAGQLQTALVYGDGTSWCFVEDGSTAAPAAPAMSDEPDRGTGLCLIKGQLVR